MTISTPTKVLYTAEAVATGEGRNGHVRSSDGMLDLELRMPPELGGPGGHPNPEQLFAAGYAACFHSALKLVAGKLGVDVSGSTVTTDVGLGTSADGRFILTAAIAAHLPKASPDEASRAVEEAHRVCPYSIATRDNIEVTISAAETAPTPPSGLRTGRGTASTE